MLTLLRPSNTFPPADGILRQSVVTVAFVDVLVTIDIGFGVMGSMCCLCMMLRKRFVRCCRARFARLCLSLEAIFHDFFF
jgi:hypothetical protein